MKRPIDMVGRFFMNASVIKRVATKQMKKLNKPIWKRTIGKR